jgi:hypothetical protein
VARDRQTWRDNRQPRMCREPERLVFIDETATTTKMTRLRGRHQLNVPEADAERVVQPDRVADDFSREAVTMVRVKGAFHPATMPHPNASRHPPELT